MAPNALHKVIYKPDSQSTDEFIVIVDPNEYKKWKTGDKSIPLALVVDAFTVFHSGQGAQGKLGQTSKQILDSVFGTEKEEEAVKIVLEKGTLQAGEGIHGSGTSTTNISRGGQGAVRSGGAR